MNTLKSPFTETAFADDATLEEVQLFHPRLESVAAKVGLLINDIQTESMSFNQMKARGSKYIEITLTNTPFADDLTLATNVLEQIQLFLVRLEFAAAEFGLPINEIILNEGEKR